MEDLQELFDLWEAELNRVPKPQLQDEMPSSNEGPNAGNFEHPVTQQRNQVDDLISAGSRPVEAHQQVYGEVDTGNVESKAKLASTLSRLEDDGTRTDIKVDKNNPPSLFAKDKAIEKKLDQVTRDDLRTPMNKQVPDRQQTPQDQMGGDVMPESLEYQEEYDYNEDVAYLQKFGRA